MSITIEALVNLLHNDTQVNIYFMQKGKTFQFETSSIPDEILNCEVLSIDDPWNQDGQTPLCINIDEEDWFDEGGVAQFIETYDDYEV